MALTADLAVSDPFPGRRSGVPGDVSVHEFLHYLSDSHLVNPAELDLFLSENPSLETGETAALVEALVGRAIINEYQAERLLAGQTFGLVLGHYRIVDQIGAGGMGAVYKAEHVHMKRVVALKVLIAEEDKDSVFLQRFHGEMQALGVLRHPNIVLAFDAGEVQVPHDFAKVLRYLVMEYVPGKDLEQYVNDHGPLPIPRACDVIRQAASGLRHAHEHGLIHRDIKPSNLLLTTQDQVKILDFGLARLCRRRYTEAHTMLGTVDFMAPEQARDARSVDIRADIYGLGGTLYWLLSGRKPFPGNRPVVEELLARQKESPTPLRNHCPDLPLELEAIVCQMLARDPGDRYQTPLALVSALNAFLEPANAGFLPGASATSWIDAPSPLAAESPGASRVHRVLLISDDSALRTSLGAGLEGPTLACVEADAAVDLRDVLSRTVFDLVLLDGALPERAAQGLARGLRDDAPSAFLKLILLADGDAAEESGAAFDDVVPREAAPARVLARLRVALRLRDAEERSDRLARHLLTTNSQLEQALQLRDNDQFLSQDVLIFAMAKMAELRGLETGAHLLRLQSYVRVLAEEAMRLSPFQGRIDAAFVRMLERCVLLHDVGKVAIPDHILLKPGRLEPEERSIMESHTLVGASILGSVAGQQGANQAFLHMATEIARHHHERFDGTGYPDGLAAESIPLAARIVAIADVYDALRSKLVYKPGLSHTASRRLILDANARQFDPALLVAFRQAETSFEQIFEHTID
jgi:response regulator RpfG family c-di-GMP phosphodiesterase/serine/threonine protein kinase